MGVSVRDRGGVEPVSLASPVLTLEGISGRPVSNTRRALRRFFQQRLAVFGLAITGFLIAVAVFAPALAPTAIEAAEVRRFAVTRKQVIQSRFSNEDPRDPSTIARRMALFD